jgi:hypothetical protein
MFKASVQNLTATETEIWGDYMYVLYIKNTNHLNDEQLNTLINFDKVTVEQKEQLQNVINNSTRLQQIDAMPTENDSTQ